MSYIIPTIAPFVSIKVTEKGREQLAKGQLNFRYWGLGDSEINYDREAVVDANQNNSSLSGVSKVFRPFDRQPNIKSFITPNTGAIYQDLNTSNINVVKAIVNNQALERGFFSGSSLSNYVTNESTVYIVDRASVNNSKFTGGTELQITSATTKNVGDYMLIKLSNNVVTGVTSTSNQSPIPHLWYKVQATAATSITLDRPLPNVSSQSTTSSEVIFYPHGELVDAYGEDSATAYWDSGTLSFNSNINVNCEAIPVWNMNNVWCEDLAGMTGMSSTQIYEDYKKFGSYSYLGTKNPYFEYLCSSSATTSGGDCGLPGTSMPDDVVKSISIIHYTNNTISNLYGEFLFVDNTNGKTVTISIPDLMYHRRAYATERGTAMGMEFVASGSTQYVGTSNVEYIDLIESPTLVSGTPLVVGRVYPQLKVIAIHDDEIVAAISYKSNRNWTLPSLTASLVAPSGGTNTGVLDMNKTMFITYTFENDTASGLTTTLPCQSYIKITNTSSGSKDVGFHLSDVDLLPYMRKLDKAGYDGIGFYGYRFKVLYQIVASSTDRPDAGSWKVYDYTTTAITTTVNTTIDPVKLENQSPTTNGFFITSSVNTGATTFDITQSLHLAPNSNTNLLQFGDERFFYGNLKTYIGATIFKTLFDIRINGSLFNTTTNPTRDSNSITNPPNIKMTEVGIFDADKNLVVIGKFSTPITLVAGSTIMAELSIDF